MTDPLRARPAPRRPDATAASSGESDDASCPRCHADLARYRAAAPRFCPRCGTSLPLPALDARRSPIHSVPRDAGHTDTVSRWLRLREGYALPAPSPRSVGPTHDNHSLMLLGYANAMYRLGWRYEKSVGGGRNVDEAVRCYFKAAKLGNADALARLTPVPAQPEPGRSDLDSVDVDALDDDLSKIDLSDAESPDPR